MKTPAYLLYVKCLLLLLGIFVFYFGYAQCSVSFGSSSGTISFSTYSGGDIVRAVPGEHLRNAAFDVWTDDSTKVIQCSTPGGLTDFSMQIEIIPTFDVYGGRVIDSFDGVTHDLTRQSNGIRGTIPFNTSGATQSSTGDVRGYQIKVEFAPHVKLTASNFQVVYSSGNSAGSVFESTCIQFLKRDGAVYAPAIYTGYYDSVSNDRIDSVCPGGNLTDTSFKLNTSPWRWTGSGTYAAQSGSTVGFGNRCKPVNGTSGPNDDKTVYPNSDAGLQNSDSIGGFIFTVLAEDVAVGFTDTGGSISQTGISSTLTSTLTGFVIPTALPVQLVHLQCQPVQQNIYKVRWTTASETDNSHFSIYQVGLSQRELLAQIPGRGNSQELVEYEVNIISHKGMERTFLLSQTDFNGTEVPLQIFVGEETEKPAMDIRILNQEYLQIESSETRGYLEVRNSVGSSIMKQLLVDGLHTIDVRSWPQGVYIVEWCHENEVILRRKFLYVKGH